MNSKTELVKRKEALIAVIHEAHYISRASAPPVDNAMWPTESTAGHKTLSALLMRQLELAIQHLRV